MFLSPLFAKDHITRQNYRARNARYVRLCMEFVIVRRFFYGIHRFRTFFAVENFTIAALTVLCVSNTSTLGIPTKTTSARRGAFADISAKPSNDFLKYEIKRNKKLGRKPGELKCKPSGEKVAGQRGCGSSKILAMPKLLCVRIGYRVISYGSLENSGNRAIQHSGT